MPHRTFLALDLDDMILDGLVAVQGKLGLIEDRVRWVGRELIHLTLQFLGDVPDELLHEVCNLAAGAAAEIEPFEFHISRVIVVPPSGPLRMVWAGVEDPAGGLAELHAALDAALHGLGLRQEERGFRPHITLARVKTVKNPVQFRSMAKQYSEIEFGTQHAEEVVVYNSQLGGDGPIYTPIARCRLGE